MAVTARTNETNAAECSAATVGLMLADCKQTLAGLQDHLVEPQTEEYRRQRRPCSHCGSQRSLKDVCTRRLLSVFGTVEVRAHVFCPADARCNCSQGFGAGAESSQVNPDCLQRDLQPIADHHRHRAADSGPDQGPRGARGVTGSPAANDYAAGSGGPAVRTMNSPISSFSDASDAKSITIAT
jgi:hypothetical protein